MFDAALIESGSGEGFAGDGRPRVPGGTGTNADFTEVAGMRGDPIPIGGDVRGPQLLSRAEPDYPEAMRRSRVEGVVIAEAVITDTGDVKSVRILHSSIRFSIGRWSRRSVGGATARLRSGKAPSPFI